MQAFRLSFYLTLALATLCLGVAETFFLGWILLLVLAALVGYWIAYRCEGRWSLSASAANGLGAFIGLLSIGWILSRVPRSEEQFLAQGVPWPAGMLPHLGPMLILLTSAKVFRPKNETDFWVLQALGMMMVMLASVLAGEFHHIVFLFLYLVSLFWCLTLHDRCRSAGLSSAETPAATPLFPPAPTGATGFGNALLLTTFACLLGLGVFYVAPRQPANQWLPYKLSSANAINPMFLSSRDTMLDLNQVGKVELSDEIAFDVVPLDSEGNRPMLPADLYWRTESLDFYRRGRWWSASQPPDNYPGGWVDPDKDFPVRVTLTNADRAPQSPMSFPEKMAEDKVYLAFRLRSTMKQIVLAETPNKDAGVGLWPEVGGRRSATALVAYYEGYDTYFSVMPQRHGAIVYGQIWDPATRLAPRKPDDRIHPMYRSGFLLQPPDRSADKPIEAFTRALLPRLPGLSAADRTLDAEGRIGPANQAKVARALARHLSDSGEYLYSLDLRLQDDKLDPIADFLINVKEGHCERYASALVLMLRSVGIPSRLVKGFHGLDKDDRGEFHVRYSHAHSWAEALVPDKQGEVWITLDPTPSQAAQPTGLQAWTAWFNDRFAESRRFFRRNVVEFDMDQQYDWFASLALRLTQPATLAGLGLVVAALVVGVVVWRRHRTSTSRTDIRADWMRSFLKLAQRHAREPRPDETWTEFIASLRSEWNAKLGGDLSAILGRIAECYDQIRFGGPPLAPARETELADGVRRLRTALEGK